MKKNKKSILKKSTLRFFDVNIEKEYQYELHPNKYNFFKLTNT